MGGDRLRVLHLYRPRLPATRAQSIQVLGTCHGLAQLGCEVTLLAETGGRRVDAAAVLEAHGLPPVEGLELRLYRGGNPALAGWWFRGQVARWLAGRGPSVVYARSKRYAVQLAGVSRIPLVIEAHEVDSAQLRERGADGAAMEALERRVFARAAAVVTNCAGTLSLLEETHGDRLPALRRAVHNATAPGRAREHAPGPSPVVGYAGSLRAYKGQATLLAAAAMLPAGVTVELLGGSDAERAALGDLAGAVRLAGELPYAGVPDRIAGWTAALMPLDDDLFGSRLCNPIKLWEYLAVGLPVVAARLPTLGEVLGPEEASWYRPGDPASLAAAIGRAVAPDAPRARRLRSWRDRAAEVLEVLTAVAG